MGRRVGIIAAGVEKLRLRVVAQRFRQFLHQREGLGRNGQSATVKVLPTASVLAPQSTTRPVAPGLLAKILSSSTMGAAK